MAILSIYIFFRDVRENISPPEGTKIVDATGKYVMPGKKHFELKLLGERLMVRWSGLTARMLSKNEGLEYLFNLHLH